MIKKTSMAFILWLFLCSQSWAEPDVFFSDSDKYEDAYLSHKLEGDKIKFLLTKPILKFELPDEYFDLNDLKNYINTKYQFENNIIKVEFEKMLNQSFNSQLKAKVFLDELLRVLAGFKHETSGPVLASAPELAPEKSSGGCSSVLGNQQSNNYFLIFLLIIYGLCRFRVLDDRSPKSA